MSVLKGACIIGQSGGPTSVINASAYGVIRTALDNENITKVYGAEHGIKGVLNDRLIDMSQEDAEELAAEDAAKEGTTCEEILGIDFEYEPIDDDARFADEYEAYLEFEWECRTGR